MLSFENIRLNAGKRQSSKAGFGIMEVMVAVLVLGFLYAAVNSLQVSNDEAVHRLRCRDGAIQVAQEIMDSLKSVGGTSIASSSEKDTILELDARTRSWERGLGGTTKVTYKPTLTVEKTSDYEVQSGSDFDFGRIQHVVAKQVMVEVQWPFKGSTQSIKVSGVIR